MLFLLAVVFTVVGCVTAQGNGTPPAVYGLSGCVMLPLAARGIGSLFRRRKTAEIVILALGGIGSFMLAYTTSRHPPREVFADVFGFPSPVTVHDLAARVQWYDGPMQYVTFRADDAAFRSIVDQARLRAERTPELDAVDPMTPQGIADAWRSNVGTWGAMAYNFWPLEKQLTSIEVYKGNHSATEPYVAVVREPGTGQVWAVSLSP